jgi:hypothetical protein
LQSYVNTPKQIALFAFQSPASTLEDSKVMLIREMKKLQNKRWCKGGWQRACDLDADPKMESASPPRGLEEDEPSDPGTAQPDPPITRSRNAIVSSSLHPLPLPSLGTVTKQKGLYYFSSSPKIFV